MSLPQFSAFVAALILTLLPHDQARAAKGANAEERSIALTGPPAAALASLFGLQPSAAGSVALPLGDGMAWAVYLLRQDTKIALYNTDGMPSRTDSLDYSPDPQPSLRISPFWLEQNTALPQPDDIHLVGSPFVANALSGFDPWTALIKRLRSEPDWRDAEWQPFERCFESPGQPRLCLLVQHAVHYPDNRKVDGFYVMITARLPKP